MREQRRNKKKMKFYVIVKTENTFLNETRSQKSESSFSRRSKEESHLHNEHWLSGNLWRMLLMSARRDCFASLLNASQRFRLPLRSSIQLASSKHHSAQPFCLSYHHCRPRHRRRSLKSVSEWGILRYRHLAYDNVPRSCSFQSAEWQKTVFIIRKN